MLNNLLEELPTAGPKWAVKPVTIVGDLKGPDGEPLQEVVELWTRDIIAVIRELLENTTYGNDMVFAPGPEWNDAEKTERKYTEMWTADWWLNLQVSCRLQQAIKRSPCITVENTSPWCDDSPGHPSL
jgi:hypothetical protein